MIPVMAQEVPGDEPASKKPRTDDAGDAEAEYVGDWRVVDFEEMASRKPQQKLDRVDAFQVAHTVENFDENWKSFTKKAEAEDVETMTKIIGTYWRIGTLNAHPIWARQQEDILRHNKHQTGDHLDRQYLSTT